MPCKICLFVLFKLHIVGVFQFFHPVHFLVFGRFLLLFLKCSNLFFTVILLCGEKHKTVLHIFKALNHLCSKSVHHGPYCLKSQKSKCLEVCQITAFGIYGEKNLQFHLKKKKKDIKNADALIFLSFHILF